MKKRSLLLALTMLLVFTLTACGSATDNQNSGENAAANGGNETTANAGENGEATEDGETLKIGFVTDEGGINDQSFNQGVWEGLQKANKDFGFEVSYQESKEANDYTPNIETLLDAGNDIIVAAGFNLADAMEEAAQNNPDVKFLVVDAGYEDGPENLTGLQFKAEEPSFLVGYIAGLTSETNKVGFVGGQESTLIKAFEVGYKAGVAQASAEKDEEVEIVSQYVGNFSDAAKGKSIATNMYQQGADVIFHASGGAGDGVIEAAKDQDKWVIGVDRDQSSIAPDNVLTSAMKRADSAIYKVLESLSKGEEFPGGQNLNFGLKEGDTVGIAPTSDKNVKPEILEKIEPLKQRIVDGEITVPTTEEEFATFEAK